MNLSPDASSTVKALTWAERLYCQLCSSTGRRLTFSNINIVSSWCGKFILLVLSFLPLAKDGCIVSALPDEELEQLTDRGVESLESADLMDDRSEYEGWVNGYTVKVGLFILDKFPECLLGQGLGCCVVRKSCNG
jgi:hypothetical protein